MGTLGDLLDGDVYSFKAIAVRTCEQPTSDAGGEAERNGFIVIGANVHIKSKGPMTISPRDVQLRSGGIIFYASLDPKRKLRGCTPLLERSMLRKQQVATGFVLFDLPTPEPRDLKLIYQPTRWGGSNAVLVTLPECVSCSPSADRDAKRSAAR